MTQQDLELSRRAALQGMAGLVIGLYLPGSFARAQTPAVRAGSATRFAPNAFVRIGSDDIVTVMVKHVELGQGPLTGLATLVAEELDADLSQMRAEHAPSDSERYKNLFLGIQGTGGSTAISNSYEQMRKAGAIARAMLVQAAADSWHVPASEITVERGVLRHEGSSRRGPFGEYAEAAARLPVPADAPLKDPSAFRLIGSDDGSVRRLDSASKSNGTARFTLDIREPGMLTVVVARPPRFGATVKTFDSTKAMAVKGVVAVKPIPTGVAVYAESTWPAIKARELLDVTWDESAAEKRGSEQIIEEYRELARTPGTVAANHGDLDASLTDADQVIEAEYVFPYLAHAPMEPIDGFLRWGGDSAIARFGSQIQTGDQLAIGAVLGIEPEKVAVETLLAGGSFGRRGEVGANLANELAHVAKAFGTERPVKLVWTREDDIQGGHYRPIVVHRMRGAIKGGEIRGWGDTVVGQSHIRGTAYEAFGLKNGVDFIMVEGAHELRYQVANFRCDAHITDIGVPVLSWRAVGHTHTGYAVECFIDELLQAIGKDPVEGRLALMGAAPREAAVLRAASELADWGHAILEEGRARGVAVVKSFGTYVAQIAEVSLGKDGEPRVHKVWCAVDCGIAVNPDIVRAQMEGGIGYGLGHVLYGEIPLDEGRPLPTNFDTYRSLRIHEMPEVDVTIVRSSESPTGVGEVGVPPIGPAVANAMARLGRVRPRRLPIVRRA